MPLRMCIGCRNRKMKPELIRLAKIRKSRSLIIDKSNKGLGRGIYICKDIRCIENIKKLKRFRKILDEKMIEQVYLNFEGEISVIR